MTMTIRERALVAWRESQIQVGSSPIERAIRDAESRGVRLALRVLRDLHSDQCWSMVSRLFLDACDATIKANALVDGIEIGDEA